MPHTPINTPAQTNDGKGLEIAHMSLTSTQDACRQFLRRHLSRASRYSEQSEDDRSSIGPSRRQGLPGGRNLDRLFWPHAENADGSCTS
jgi:hypothetical protein